MSELPFADMSEIEVRYLMLSDIPLGIFDDVDFELIDQLAQAWAPIFHEFVQGHPDGPDLAVWCA